MLRVAVLIASLLAADVTVAAAQTPTRIRGTIESATEQALTIKSREGQTVTVTLAPNFAVVAVSKASLGDIKSGSFVGAAALPQSDGTFKAQEVLVFPEAMRGSNEGHYPWDLSPGSTMTNAAVTAMVSGNDGTALTLKHKDGEVKVVVPPDAPIVTLGPGDKSLLVPGAGVFVPASRAADGALSAGRVLVGKDGLMPPM
jgi:Domain of unknown function (DUF5666)